MQPICKVKVSIDSFFIDLSTAICFVRVFLARAEIFTIYYRLFEVRNQSTNMDEVVRHVKY